MKGTLKKAAKTALYKLTDLFMYLTNATYRAQKKDPFTIPVIIINFNQLYYLRQLISFLQSRKFKNIVIIDNKSTYRPLLDYYEEIRPEVTLHLLEENHGHMVFFKNKELYEKYSGAYFIVTDADIVPNPATPENFLATMMQWLHKDLYARKVGFALKVSDIPDYYPLKNKVLAWEEKFWTDRLAENIYRADIDTTFALYRPGNPFYQVKNFYSGIRIAGAMEARHGGWYSNPEHLTDEERFYRNTANLSSSWNMDEKGSLKGTHSDQYKDGKM